MTCNIGLAMGRVTLLHVNLHLVLLQQYYNMFRVLVFIIVRHYGETRQYHSEKHAKTPNGGHGEFFSISHLLIFVNFDMLPSIFQDFFLTKKWNKYIF